MKRSHSSEQLQGLMASISIKDDHLSGSSSVALQAVEPTSEGWVAFEGRSEEMERKKGVEGSRPYPPVTGPSITPAISLRAENCVDRSSSWIGRSSPSFTPRTHSELLPLSDDPYFFGSMSPTSLAACGSFEGAGANDSHKGSLCRATVATSGSQGCVARREDAHFYHFLPEDGERGQDDKIGAAFGMYKYERRATTSTEESQAKTSVGAEAPQESESEFERELKRLVCEEMCLPYESFSD